MIDDERAAAAVQELLQALGYDTNDEAIRDTPKRVAKAMREATAGRFITPEEILATTFEAKGYDEVILLRDIAFYSMCEHHLLPFHGTAHVAYIPGSSDDGHRVVGLSKLARLVDIHARRLQLQERMTADIAGDLERVLRTKGVAVVIRAQHLCMCSRGISKPDASMVTSVMRGAFLDKPAARAELLELMR